MRVRLFIAFAALCVFTVTADAHHSIAGMYDQSRRVTLDGVIAQYQFVNPHPFVVVDVTMNGATQSWKAELDNRWELENVGMTPTTFNAGDRVVVNGLQRVWPGALLKSEVAEMGARGAQLASGDDSGRSTPR